MYITQLHVKNMKRMRDLALDFTHEARPRMWTVFVAENGACKTTLLQAIALMASGSERANQLADVPSLPDLRHPDEAVQISATPPASPKLMTGSEIYSSFFNIQKLYPSDLGDELRRYTYLSSDPTRTDEEDAEMLRLRKKLTDAGLDLGLPPVPRDLP